MEPAPPIEVVALVKDLILSSRILAVAESVGVSVRLIRDPAKVVGVMGRRLLVDLNQAGSLESAIAWRDEVDASSANREVVGFVSHVDEATIREAREAGVDRILARSAFVERLAELVR